MISTYLHLVTTALLSLLVVLPANAFDLSPQEVNGIYVLAIPERSAAGQVQKLEIEFGEINGKKLLATRGCSRCPAAAYSYLPVESKELGRPVFFNSMGIYIVAYDSNTFVSAMADGQLGKKVWSNLAYANVYSKQGTPTIGLEDGKAFVLAESKRLITGEGVAKFDVTGGSGIYYAAVRQAIGSAKYDQINVKLVSKKEIVLEGMNCSSCRFESYQYQDELSVAIGKDVYVLGHMGEFVIEQEKGVLWRINTQLGEKEWGSESQFNVLTQDKTAARQLPTNQAKLSQIETTLKAYSAQAKAAVEARHKRKELARITSERLPQKGLNNEDLEQTALVAAKDWAGSYGWKEELKYVIITDRDWSIIRNNLTGIQTGRRIQGVIAMKHPDGLCRYQYATFDQAYNGTDYQNTVMSSVVGDNNKIACNQL